MTDQGSTLPPPGTPTPSQENVPTKPWWRRWYTIVGAVLVLLVVIAGVFGGGEDDEAGNSSSDTTPPATETSPDTEAPAATDAPPTTEAPSATDAPQSTEAPTTSSAPTTTLPSLPGFDSGIILVGADADPGVYMATVPDEGFGGCYWERLSDLSGDFEAILANGNVSQGAQALVEILASDEAFNSSDCGRWTLFIPYETPVTEFGEGTWSVNGQIAPGRYRSTGPGEGTFGGCYWERLSGLSGGFDSIIANDNVDGPAIVDIAGSDVGFSSNDCGDWSLVE